MQSKSTIYSGHVFVNAAEMKLHCEQLTLNLPTTGNKHPNRILAETNVVVDYIDQKGQTNHLTADQAVYVYQVENSVTNGVEQSVTNETVTFTGNPVVETDDYSMTGEPLYWTRINGQKGSLHADNPHIKSKKTLDEIQHTNASGQKLF
jgi:lipopolysaccharide export system protein LptA